MLYFAGIPVFGKEYLLPGTPFLYITTIGAIMKKIAHVNKNTETDALVNKTMPWLFGAGIAAGHLLTSSSCTLPQQGRCAVCGGCVIALGSLVGWAMLKKHQGDDFYNQ